MTDLTEATLESVLSAAEALKAVRYLIGIIPIHLEANIHIIFSENYRTSC
jgi:hypothetical protein